MSPNLNSLLKAQLASDPFYGRDAVKQIYALTLIAGSSETSLAVATEATRECRRILQAECEGLIISPPDGSRLVQNVARLPRAWAAIEARSVAGSEVMRRVRQRGAE